ncbi:hypothetical protein E5720_20775 [Rhodococcus sp. PAMC28707]|uniref:hypothetical protein n=1 Tax=unclassified Rhodococcus (in: high G+C Gram-positive bacteria) TaxID=192944 RepID=UPI00109D8E1A|nr:MULTISPECIES: hypothetical protein [unclassified Rhodococcus (in: high G+C Gram-positive bacteria)]QCB51289.1 hypothetical protein E5769_14750 [Rhodococcus sp. PAMC28705]QCB60543.1 hypothetical protein E5720_20775 [Rhodococcus sp. PAMC28707]
MRLQATTVVVLAAALVGCANTDIAADQLNPTIARPQPPSEQSELYVAALHQLVLVDNPFARAPSPVRYVYIVDGSKPPSPVPSFGTEGMQIESELKNEITAQSGDLPPIEFIASPDQRADPERSGLTGVENDGVIISFVPTQRQENGTAHVGAYLWCGIDCGIGLTYVLDNVDGHWTVTGTTGSISIS